MRIPVTCPVCGRQIDRYRLLGDGPRMVPPHTLSVLGVDRRCPGGHKVCREDARQKGLEYRPRPKLARRVRRQLRLGQRLLLATRRKNCQHCGRVYRKGYSERFCSSECFDKDLPF